MAGAHDVAPFRLAERQDAAGLAGHRWGQHGHVDLDLGPALGVGNDTGADLAGELAEQAGRGEGRVVTAELLEMGAEDLRGEARAGVTPDRGGPATFQEPPAGPHDDLVEDDQRLGDPVHRPALAEQVLLPAQQPAILQDTQVVGDVGGLPADVARDAAAGVGTAGDSGEHRVVHRRIADAGLLVEQVAGLPEQRAARVEDRAQHPVVEVAGTGGDVVVDEPAIGRGAADDGVLRDRQPRIRDAPKLSRQRVLERVDHDFQVRPAAQRRAAGQQPAHHRQRRATQQQ